MPNAVIFSSLAPLRSVSSTPPVRKLPRPLTSLHMPKYLTMKAEELKAACEDVFDSTLVVTKEEAAYLEESTRLQSQSLLWYEHRKGRITASRFRAVSRASTDSPPASLIKALLQETKFDSSKVPALHWGISNEDEARKDYLEAAQQKHVDLHCSTAGLHVNPTYPHLGATPDGIVTCDCCGKGLIEIKCPFKHRAEHPKNVGDPSFYLKRNEDGELHLCHNHEYFYQIRPFTITCRHSGNHTNNTLSKEIARQRRFNCFLIDI